MLTVYTLKNCDTCKKAIKWLEAKNIDFQNHDVRADGLTQNTIAEIVSELGWETALNRRSTTWRNLSDTDKTDMDNNKAVSLIEVHPTLLKRPVFVSSDGMEAGFTDAAKALAAG